MRAHHLPEKNGLSAALIVYLSIYCFVFILFAIFLYSLLQPRQVPNPGLAAYKPPPRTVISYDLPPRLLAHHGQPPPLSELLPAPEADETTGRSVRTVEVSPEPPPAPSPQRTKVVRPTKPSRVATPAREHSNSGGAYAAAYPSYSGNRPF
jgi:hypothetical protein